MERKASSALVNRVYVRHISSADRSLRLLLRRYEPSIMAVGSIFMALFALIVD